MFFDSEIGRVEISDDPANVFAAPVVPMPGYFLPIGELLEIDVLFSPLSFGVFNAHLAIASSDLRWPDLDIPLRGRGVRSTVAEPPVILLLALAGLLLASSRTRSLRA